MRFEAKDGEATLWIYDAIGEMFGTDAVTAKGVRDRLASLRGISKLVIRINSPGGEVDDATTIHTLLSEFAGEKLVKVDGMAASAASVIAMAGDKIQMAKGAKMMIHNPWGFAVGDYRQLAKASEVAKQYRNALVGLYSARSGKSSEEVMSAMDAEKYFLAEEAVAWGVADSVGDDAAIAATQTGEEIVAQAMTVARLAFANLVGKTAADIESTFASMDEQARVIAANRRLRAMAHNKQSRANRFR